MSGNSNGDGAAPHARPRLAAAAVLLGAFVLSVAASCQPSDPDETGTSGGSGPLSGGESSGANTANGGAVTSGGSDDDGAGGASAGTSSGGGSAGRANSGGNAAKGGAAGSASASGGKTNTAKGGAAGAAGAVSKGGAGPVAGPSDRILYPNGRVQSPINATVAERLRSIVGMGSGDTGVFMKAGDAISQGLEYLGCAEDANLSGHTALEPTIDFFAMKKIGKANSFTRDSVATFESGTSWDALQQGVIEEEAMALNPAYALIMFGSVDLGDGGTLDANPRTDATKFMHYGQAMWTITDQLIQSGIIPILRSTAPRQSGDELAPQASTFALLVRAIAEGRQVPYSEFYGEMIKVPGAGLYSDGLHINSFNGGQCVFTNAGLMYGYNIMNLLSLESLDRVKRVVVDEVDSLDDDATALAGEGTVAAPFEVPELPFTDLRDLSQATSKELSQYSGCGGKNEGGAEFVYKVELAASVRARAVVVERSGSKADASLHHFSGSTDAASCDGSNTTMIQKSFAKGTHYFVVDTAATAAAGDEYILAILPCEAQDDTCG